MASSFSFFFSCLVLGHNWKCSWITPTYEKPYVVLEIKSRVKVWNVRAFLSIISVAPSSFICLRTICGRTLGLFLRLLARVVARGCSWHVGAQVQSSYIVQGLGLGAATCKACTQPIVIFVRAHELMSSSTFCHVNGLCHVVLPSIFTGPAGLRMTSPGVQKIARSKP